MSKKEKTRKKVFGLVSKLGNLIKKGGTSTSSTENMDTSAGENETPKKNFNIHISEDNQEVFAIGDEEEEEEEDEDEQETKKETEQKNKKDKKDNKDIKNDINSDNKKDENIDNNNKENKNLENIEDNKENIKDIKNNDVIDKKDNFDKENKDEINLNKNINDIKNDTKNMKEIKEEINTINIIKEEKKEEIKEELNIENKEQKLSNEIIESKENNIIEDINEECHIYLKKGNDFNSSGIYCLPLTQLKNRKKNSFLQKMNVFKKAKDSLIKYKIFFEDNFIYFAKDIIIDKKNENLRRIHKILNIRNILSYNSNKEQNDNYKINIEIMNKKYINKKKEFIIEEKYFNEFNNLMIKKLEIYGDRYIKSNK
jgi:hypothetical protein